MEKICTKCQLPKQLNEFYQQKAFLGRRPRKQSICKQCNRERLKNRYNNEPDFRQNKIEISRKWYNQNQCKYRDRCLRKNYGITLAQYNEMLTTQNGVCAICELPETQMKAGKVRPLQVDHNHTTKVVRGLLCHHCNTGIGSFKDNIIILDKAKEYLCKEKA